jgi:peroxiredoxin
MSAGLPQVGHRAPDFTLPSTAGGGMTLSSFRGRSNVLLAFFPLAFTGVCTAEMCSLSGDLPQFAAMHATVIGISVDSIPTLHEFRRKENIAIDLLSDFRREVCRLYGTLDEDLFLSQRAYVLVDREGIVRWTHLERSLGDRRDNAELLAEITRLA